jgi:hypothetical protein
MISELTLLSVKVGILNDDQLREAIKHYKRLEEDLKCHGDLYRLVWIDVRKTLDYLEDMKRLRKEK